jgi:6-phosphogluconate dehydrogenase
MELQVPVPTIDMAVAMRDLSGYKAEREIASKNLSVPVAKFDGDKKAFIQKLHNALSFGMIATYSQGMALLKTASQTYNYGLQLHEVARIWRGGCIIRARLLEDIRSALKSQPDLPNLMLDAKLSQMLVQRQEDLRNIVHIAVESGIPAPGLMASLAYFDGYRSGWLPANLIQAQRDYFGSHTYERIDEKGVFHTLWDQGLSG